MITQVIRVTVSEPYVSVAGSWAGMRETGIKRTYRAIAVGRDFVNTSKSGIQDSIRRAIYRAETEAGFVHVPVKFYFVPEGDDDDD